MRLENASTYPRTYAVLKDIKNLCLGDAQIKNSFLKYSKYSWAEIGSLLSLGTYPEIILVSNLTSKRGYTAYGIFNKTYGENIIRVRKNVVMGVEQAKLEHTIYATALFLAITMLHELVHYCRYHKKVKVAANDHQEYVFDFEQIALGFSVELDNVSKRCAPYKKYFKNLQDEIRRENPKK